MQVTTQHTPNKQGDSFEHHTRDKYQSTFITKYIFSTDHKMIAKQYLITGIVWAVIGAMMSLIFRLQLGFPEEDYAWLRPLIGKWILISEDGTGTIDPDFYYAMVTIHGTIMVFFVLTGSLSGTFSNLLIPLQLGARDMASPLLNMIAYWLFLISTVIMGSSLFLSTGAFGGGWVHYPPLSALPQAMSGSGAGMTLWIISIIVFIASVLIGGINYITTILNMRTKGMSLWRMPLTVWTFLVTAIVGLLSFPVLLAALCLLMMDRFAGTSFFLSEIYIGGEALNQVGGSAILYQHLFWFLGHPEVYIVILPAMGIVSEVMSINSRKPIFGYKAMVYSVAAIGFLSFLVWAHHMFMSGMNPFIGNFFALMTLIIAIPSAVKVFNWIGTVYRGNIRFNSAMLFSLGFVSMFISGGLTGIFLGNPTIDIQLHDTYFVVAHFHIIMGVAAFFGTFVGVYHWFPKMFGRYMNETLGKIHFWGTFLGAYLIFWPMHYLGLAGVPRRYYRFDTFDAFSHFADMNAFITIVSIVTFGLQLLFIANFILSIWKGRIVTSKNPWSATTLEWTTPIVPGHGNWEGPIPEVHRWAYDYSKPDVDADFIPQTSPIQPQEKPVEYYGQ